ncbi:MAG: OsmC family protein [Planctomyces sp.]|nr:OsmC family protein [Planctomyces sp.]
MTADELRALQAPLKERFRADPEQARATMSARAVVDPGRIAAEATAPQAPTVVAGLHPLAGGEGTSACAGDMLLQALAACAGVTLGAVSTAMAIPIRGCEVVAEGDLDFRGTLGVDRNTPVGFQAIRLTLRLDTDAGDESLAKLAQLTERYCVVAASLKGPIEVRTERIPRAAD